MHKAMVFRRCSSLAWPQAAHMDGGTAGHTLAGGLVACARAETPGRAALAPLLLQLHLAVAVGAQRTQDRWKQLMLLTRKRRQYTPGGDSRLSVLCEDGASQRARGGCAGGATAASALAAAEGAPEGLLKE